MEADVNLLITAGIAAAGCIAVGLVMGILRGHFVTERLRREMAADNDQLKSELAEARSHIRGLSVELEQGRKQLRENLARLGDSAEQPAGGTRK